MKTLPVAVQIYSVRDDAQKDFKATMLKLKEIGYDGVELAGFYGMKPEYVRDVLKVAGLTAVSAHVPFGDFRDGIEKTVADYVTVGCEYVALPYLPEDMRPANCDFDAVIGEIKAIGRACANAGVTLLYHNHDFEFEKMEDGAYLLDHIYANVPEELLKVQPDTCWIHVSGVNPSEYIRKYAGRCPVVHLKDYTGAKTANMYELIGDGKTASAPAEKFQFRSVGSGVQDIPDVLKTSVECGAKWVVVEQDFSLTQPMLEAVKDSREYLRSLGW